MLPVATSWLKRAYPQPPVFGNRLLSFSIRKACVGAFGTSTAKVASVLFLKLHWSFAILEPSGKGWPLPGTPALYALIMVGLATITLSTSSVRADETTAQSSYPLKSENAIPLGDFSEYLSCAYVSLLFRSMADPLLTGISICKSSSKTRFLHSDQSPVNNLPASQ